MNENNEMKTYLLERDGPTVILNHPSNGRAYVQLLAVKTCPKCQGYMQTIPVDVLSAAILGCLGRWRCNTCGYIPSLDTYDKKGAEQDKKFINTLLVK